jgi:methionine-rich copper-binding protein CopC
LPSVPSRSRSRRAVLAGVAGLILAHREAAAHAILESSEPAAGATIHPGTVVLRLRFNSRIDRSRSGLTMTRPDLTKIGVPIDPEGPPAVLTATVTLTTGPYVVRWQVLAVDGHITRGDVPFTVTEH